jgi:hypothetical protein
MMVSEQRAYREPGRRSPGRSRLSIDANARSRTVNSLDLAKRDMTLGYGGRTFVLRAYREDGTWQVVIVERRTPISHWLGPTADSATCLAAAVGFIAATVDAACGP